MRKRKSLKCVKMEKAKMFIALRHQKCTSTRVENISSVQQTNGRLEDVVASQLFAVFSSSSFAFRAVRLFNHFSVAKLKDINAIWKMVV